MNKNIKVINKDLWLVDFNYVRAGYINEIKFSDTSFNEFFALSTDGKVLLDASSPKVKLIADFMIVVMAIPHAYLETEKGLMKFIRNSYPNYKYKNDAYLRSLHNFNAIKENYYNIARFEKVRRGIKSSKRR